jgi:hypothetical protein
LQVDRIKIQQEKNILLKLEQLLTTEVNDVLLRQLSIKKIMPLIQIKNQIENNLAKISELDTLIDEINAENDKEMRILFDEDIFFKDCQKIRRILFTLNKSYLEFNFFKTQNINPNNQLNIVSLYQKYRNHYQQTQGFVTDLEFLYTRKMMLLNKMNTNVVQVVIKF